MKRLEKIIADFGLFILSLVAFYLMGILLRMYWQLFIIGWKAPIFK